MALTAVIIVIVIIFTLFSYFICCYKSDEEKEAQRFETRTSNRVQEQPTFQVSSTPSAIPQPHNIGFNLNGRDPVTPVGAAPTGAYQAPYPPYPSNMMPYPSAAAPYPPDTSSGYTPVGFAAYSMPNPSAPVCTTNPSAPITDSQPPSYYEATGQYPSSSRQQPPYPLNK